MLKAKTPKQNHERGIHRLFYTGDGDFDPSWFLVLTFTALAGAGIYADIHKNGTVSWHAWSFLAGAFLSVLIAAVPINKARLLAKSTAVTGFANAVGQGGGDVWKDNERDPDWDTKTDHSEAPA